MPTEPSCAPNHHAHYPAFAGLTGLLAAASMVVGRTREARLVAQLIHLRPGDIVVDVGCGPGAAARHAVKSGASVIGVDPAPVMRRAAQLLTRRSGAARFVDGRAEALPVADGSAAVVWAIASVHHWDDVDAGLREVRRVLSPGGRFVAIERQAPPGARGHASHGWTDEQSRVFAGLCEGHGLLGVEVERHTGGRRTTLSVTAMAPDGPPARGR